MYTREIGINTPHLHLSVSHHHQQKSSQAFHSYLFSRTTLYQVKYFYVYNSANMRIQQLLTLTSVLLTGNLALGDTLDQDDVPTRCWGVCGPVVGMSHQCDNRFDDDAKQRDCICQWKQAPTLVPLCEACISQHHNETRVGDHDHDHDYDNDQDRDNDQDNDRDNDNDRDTDGQRKRDNGKSSQVKSTQP